MKDNLALPSCIHPTRKGQGESEYDSLGLLAPVTWQCDCGAKLTLEVFDFDTDQYRLVSKQVKNEFLAKHTACTAVCYSCRVVPVDRYGHWCDNCSDNCS